VSRVVILDSGPLGMLCNTRVSRLTLGCNQWLNDLLVAANRVAIPEIADYEVRREMLRMQRAKNLARLDRLTLQLDYWPLHTAAMRKAAEFWALARQQGHPTAASSALDADVILAAQVAVSGENDYVVATTNVGHLSRFVAAELWQNIRP
jgi:predicted nucleic acid-binding protein